MKPEQLALARKLLGLTQVELAQVLDVHARTVSRWERGELKPTRLQELILDGVLWKSAHGYDSRVFGTAIRVMFDQRDLLVAHGVLVNYADHRDQPS